MPSPTETTITIASLALSDDEPREISMARDDGNGPDPVPADLDQIAALIPILKATLRDAAMQLAVCEYYKQSANTRSENGTLSIANCFADTRDFLVGKRLTVDGMSEEVVHLYP